jgi:hypothetical protein
MCVGVIVWGTVSSPRGSDKKLHPMHCGCSQPWKFVVYLFYNCNTIKLSHPLPFGLAVQVNASWFYTMLPFLTTFPKGSAQIYLNRSPSHHRLIPQFGYAIQLSVSRTTCFALGFFYYGDLLSHIQPLGTA